MSSIKLKKYQAGFRASKQDRHYKAVEENAMK